jgi:hypothetical protein
MTPVERQQKSLYRRVGAASATAPHHVLEGESETKLEQEETKEEKELVEADLAMATHHHTVAVEKHHSRPRANFNMGFTWCNKRRTDGNRRQPKKLL